MTTAIWAGRLEGKADDLFREFNDSLPFDRALVREDIEGSVAWSKAIMRAGVITADEQREIEAALGEILALAKDDPSSILDAEDEDVHSWVERQLVLRVGDLGKKLHTGRSRNDQVATDVRLWLRSETDVILGLLAELQGALVDVADKNVDVILPGFTHLQVAQPVSFAHHLLAYVEMFARDAERMVDVRRRTNRLPLGSAALAGTTYPLDRAQVARALGMVDEHGQPAICQNSLDAVSDRDFAIEFTASASLCMVHISRLSEELILWMSQNFGFVRIADRFTTGSSIMPQKKNPDVAELARGKSGRLIGNLTGLLVTIKALPLAYNKDLQEDKEPLFDAMRQLSMCLRILPPMVAGIKVNRENALVAAAEGYTNATDLADYLTRLGVPFREAHHQAGRLVRKAIEAHSSLEELPLDVIREQAPRANNDVYTQLTVSATLEKRGVTGGTGPKAVESAIERVRRMLRERAVPAGAGEVEFRQARADDLDAICWLVDHWAEHGENLPRSREDIMKAILDFGVAVVDGKVVGCAALWIYTPQLAEIRSLGVHPEFQGKGVGQGLVRYFLQLADQLHIPKVFVLTRAPKFFEKAGFRQVSVNSLPEKVLKDCAGCPKREQCDEIALVHDVAVGGR